MASTALPSTMRALLHNLKEQSLAIKSIPLPTPSANQYLVKPLATAFTVGELFWPRPEELNVSTPGVEYVARVVKSPSAASKFQPGDKVYARVTYPQPGAAREFTLTTDDEIALTPKNLSTAEATAVPVSALTAWEALFEEIKFTAPTTTSTPSSNANKRILITAASGSVGLWAVQLAKLAGLYVVATAGSKNIDQVKELGADVVLDYTTTDVGKWAQEDPSRKVDFVFDCIGRSALAQAWQAVKDGGRIVSIVPPPDMQWKFDLDRPQGVSESTTGKFFIMHPSGDILGKITEFIEAEKVRPVVDSVWKFEEYEKAFERLASGKTRGKVVLTVIDEE